MRHFHLVLVELLRVYIDVGRLGIGLRYIWYHELILTHAILLLVMVIHETRHALRRNELLNRYSDACCPVAWRHPILTITVVILSSEVFALVRCAFCASVVALTIRHR